MPERLSRRTEDRNATIDRLCAMVVQRFSLLQSRGLDVTKAHHSAAAHIWSDRRGGRLHAIQMGMDAARAGSRFLDEAAA